MKKLTNLLYPPYKISKNFLIGDLYVRGNIEENTIQFLFKFSDPSNIVPLKISYQSNEQIYSCLLTQHRKNKATVESFLFDPDFFLKDGIIIIKIEPLIEVCV